MNPIRFFTALILPISVCFILIIPAWSAPPSSTVDESAATFTVFFDADVSVVVAKGDTIGLQPRQAVTVVAQYPLGSVGHPIAVVPLDGGRVFGANKQLVVATDGTIQFQFRAGADTGAYQISLRDGAQEIGLNFWVFDFESASNNPVVVNQ